MEGLIKGIYPVITEKFCLNGSSVETLKKVLKGGAKQVQLREKDYPIEKIYEMAMEFRKLTRDAGALLIINDYPNIALVTGSDGVHIGQGDIPIKSAKIAMPGLIFGVSTHNLKEAIDAQDGGAGYINIGPVFSTTTKETGIKPLGLEAIRAIAGNINVPFSVMGGINAGNIAEVIGLGARCVAVVTAVTMSPDPERAVRELNNIICKYK